MHVREGWRFNNSDLYSMDIEKKKLIRLTFSPLFLSLLSVPNDSHLFDPVTDFVGQSLQI